MPDMWIVIYRDNRPHLTDAPDHDAEVYLSEADMIDRVERDGRCSDDVLDVIRVRERMPPSHVVRDRLNRMCAEHADAVGYENDHRAAEAPPS